jgi:hypothetical protein
MNVNEAKEAFIKTVDSIIDPLLDKGLVVDTRYFFSDRDLIEIPDADACNAAVLAAEIRIVDMESHAELAMEAAVAIENGEILNDEIAREASTLRESVKEILEALEVHSVKDAFDAVIPHDDEDEPERPAFDNKMYYIIGGIAILLIIIGVAIFKR